MSGNYDRAMERVRDEMAKSREPSVQAAGEMVTCALREHPEYGDAIAAAGKDKTLAALYAKMRSVAEKKKQGNCYFMPPVEAEAIMREFYGIAAGKVTSSVSPSASHLPNEGKALGDGAGELDALLAGL